ARLRISAGASGKQRKSDQRNTVQYNPSSNIYARYRGLKWDFLVAISGSMRMPHPRRLHDCGELARYGHELPAGDTTSGQDGAFDQDRRRFSGAGLRGEARTVRGASPACFAAGPLFALDADHAPKRLGARVHRELSVELVPDRLGRPVAK